MTILTIGVAQIAPKLGDLEYNLKVHQDIVSVAQTSHIDLVVFPELSMTGYQLQNLVPNVALTYDEIKKQCQLITGKNDWDGWNVDVVVGYILRDGRGILTPVAAYYSPVTDELILHKKVHLPTYGQFDEARYVGHGDSFRAFDTRFGRVGIMICEDYWHPSSPYLLWADGADIFIITCASPGRGLNGSDMLSTTEFVYGALKTMAATYTNIVIHSNRVGYEDGKIFWGGSTVVSPSGDFLAEPECFNETLVIVRTDTDTILSTREKLPLLRDENFAQVARNLNQILKGQEQSNE